MAILKKHKNDDENEDEDSFYMEDSTTPWYSRVARFFGSFLGLLIILAAYTIGGAYYFYNQESPIEESSHQAMLTIDLSISDSIDYAAEYLRNMHYNPYWSYNNCSKQVIVLIFSHWCPDLTNDTFFVETGRYFFACTGTDPRISNSTFCKCIDDYRWRIENDASMIVNNLMNQVVSACINNRYNLDANGNTTWIWAWTVQSGILFTLTTLATIGYGNITPTTQTGQLVCVGYTIVGLGVMMIFLSNIGDLMGSILRFVYSRICCRWCRIRRMKSEHLNDNNAVVTLKYDNVGQEEYMPTSEVSVPIIVTLCVMFAYIVTGAVVYTNWEDWTLTDATYFSFVTLSTIGFGDFVPGKNDVDKGSLSSIFKLLFTSIYCLMGLALISMGISLMQEQVMAKASWLAEEIGLTKKEEQTMYILTKYYDVLTTPIDGMHNIRKDSATKKKNLQYNKSN